MIRQYISVVVLAVCGSWFMRLDCKLFFRDSGNLAILIGYCCLTTGRCCHGQNVFSRGVYLRRVTLCWLVEEKVVQFVLAASESAENTSILRTLCRFTEYAGRRTPLARTYKCFSMTLLTRPAAPFFLKPITNNSISPFGAHFSIVLQQFQASL